MSKHTRDERLTVSVVSADDPTIGIEQLGTEVSAVGVLIFESEAGPVLDDGASSAAITRLLGNNSDDSAGVFAHQGFSAKAGQTLQVLRPDNRLAVVYLGCGKRERFGADDLRRAAAVFVRAAGRSGIAVLLLSSEVADFADSTGRRAAQVIAEGAILGSYRFTSHKRDDDTSRVDRLLVLGVGLDARELEAGAKRGSRIAEAVWLARDLVNEPPSSMTPTRLAEVAHELFDGSAQTTLQVWDSERIEAERLGGLLGVARGSAEPPRLIRVDYEPREADGPVQHVVLVGKGITFDSGGLSLKTAEGMVTMKTDMSGAAAVLATISACSDLDVAVRVTAIAPVTENMPGGRATKPGDVLTIRDGQTIEVLNTDAEGRLVLADALTLAAELEPDAIVDLATLTGAQVVALGSSIAALFANREDLAARIQEAASRAGEPVWRLPLPEEYASHIDSEVADMKNLGKAGQAGAIAAALLLQRFVNGTAWAHIDIAGPARSDEDQGVLAKGGTGFGVRTLLELLLASTPAPPERTA